jgi:hypothetical protein
MNFGRAMFFSSPGRALGLLAYILTLAGRVFGSASIPGGTLIAVGPRAAGDHCNRSVFGQPGRQCRGCAHCRGRLH